MSLEFTNVRNSRILLGNAMETGKNINSQEKDHCATTRWPWALTVSSPTIVLKCNG
jgi:hypothetical protein